MAAFILDSFKDNNALVKGNSFFLIIVFLRDIGLRIKPLEKEEYYILMETIMRVNGLKVKNKARASTINLTDLFVQQHGKMMFSMEKLSKSILMVHNMLENIIKGSSKETVSLFGRMVLNIKETL
jgi:hypothetical protein